MEDPLNGGIGTGWNGFSLWTQACMHAVKIGDEVWAGLERPGLLLQKKPPREKDEMSAGASGSLSPSNSQFNKHEWKYIASEKTTSKSIMLHLTCFCLFLKLVFTFKNVIYCNE